MAKASQSVQNQAYKWVLWQFLVIVALAVFLFFVRGVTSAWSELLGGVSYVLPNFFFVWRVFSRVEGQNSDRFMVAFILGETAKLFLSGMLFVLIIKYLPVEVLSVLGGFIAAILAFWVVAFVFMLQEQSGEGL